MGCHCVSIMVEQCDDTVDCTTLGYYGGTASCDPNCGSRNLSTCDPCAPGDTTCIKMTTNAAPSAIAVNGSSIAVLSFDGMVLVDSGLANPVSVAGNPARGVAPMDTGWVMIVGWDVIRVDADGTIGDSYSLGTSIEGVTSNGTTALAAWNKLSTVYAAVIDSPGVPRTPVPLFASSSSVGVTSDGTAFFVGSQGTVERITSAGDLSSVAGFPVQPDPASDLTRLRWAGTTGWYISQNSTTHAFTVQKFDASAMRVGSAMSLDLGDIVDFVALGSDLIALERASNKYSVVRISSTGSVSTAIEVGAGMIGGAIGVLGNELVAAWDDSGLVLARVTPP